MAQFPPKDSWVADFSKTTSPSNAQGPKLSSPKVKHVARRKKLTPIRARKTKEKGSPMKAQNQNTSTQTTQQTPNSQPHVKQSTPSAPTTQPSQEQPSPPHQPLPSHPSPPQPSPSQPSPLHQPSPPQPTPTQTTTQQPSPQTTQQPTPQTTTQQPTKQPPQHSTYNERKMAKTTARKRGVNADRTKRGGSQGKTNEERSSRSRRAKTTAMGLGFVDEDGPSSVSESEDWNSSASASESDYTNLSLVIESGDDSDVLEYDPTRAHDWVYEEDKEEPDYITRVYKNGEIYEEKEFGHIKLKCWMIFLDKQYFLGVLRDYCVQEGFDLVRERNERHRYTALCADPKCEWRIHASVLPDKVTWAIKTLTGGEHKCDRKDKNMMASSDWLAWKLTEDIRSNPTIPIKSLIDLCFERYGVDVAGSTMYNVRRKALAEIDEAHDASFGLLPKYIVMVKQVHPNAKTWINWVKAEEDPERALQFKRMYVSFDAQFKGFMKGCRPLIGIDGCHLKGNYNGMLLSAVALDGNQEIFPLAYAIVRGETTDTWRYFLNCLERTLRESGREDWTFMSDRQKGCETALAEVFPKASRRVCCRHLFKNFSGEFKGPHYEAYFWQAADAYNEYVFNKAMDKIKELSDDACDYLDSIEVSYYDLKQCFCKYKVCLESR